ncbi:hypothetical protein ABPG74_011725 [Tetrahymena malaccensis]
MGDNIKEEQKQSVDQENLKNDPQYNLSFVHITTDTVQKKIILEPALKQSKQSSSQDQNEQKKCKLFNINKGKLLIYNSLLEIYNKNKTQDTKQLEITLASVTTASYMLTQVLADLQYNDILTINKTTNKTTKETYGIEISVTFKEPKTQ